MTESYAMLAVYHELNQREFSRRLTLFPEDLRYYIILATGIIGSEMAKKVGETPAAVVRQGEGFVESLIELVNPGDDETFRHVLEVCLIDILRDEIRFSCKNCRKFPVCLDAENSPLEALFRRRVEGDESPSLRDEIAGQIDETFRKAPYIESDAANRECPDFSHQYTAGHVGEVFGRYASIASTLMNQYGIDRERVLRQMVDINLDFCGRAQASIDGDDA